ncbi:MAG: pyrroline-5-carboxylate reductase [Phycisphaerales bacterium]|nr:pyrroline-5-carboxylate reductase [Phycisphaerales bacterium]
MSDTAAHIDVCPLLVIGGGSMAHAILSGAAGAGLLDGPVVVAEPDDARRAGISAVDTAIDAVATVADACEALPYADAAVLLCVKPQALAGVLDEIRAANGDDMLGGRCCISILAGVTVATLTEATRARVVRTMPNLPIATGHGATALSASDDATGEDLDRAHRLFGAASRVYDLPEAAIDAFTGAAGSGPAYAFLMAEGLIAGVLDAGREAGLGEDNARSIVAQTLLGAGAMLAQECRGELPDPAGLRVAVTSPGGTTAAALEVLEARGVRDAVREAVLAAARRAGELGS